MIRARDVLIHAPASAGPLSTIAAHTRESANQTIPLLVEIGNVLGTSRRFSAIDIQSFYAELGLEPSPEATRRLGSLYEQHGSDKSNTHDYHRVYAALLQYLEPVASVFELGLGSNNPQIESNMAGRGTPGGSLRALRDYLPNSQLFGADIDQSLRLTEERLTTYTLDQTDFNAWLELDKRLPIQLDLIIDDGLHAPYANLQTLRYAIRRMSEGRTRAAVIEDIPERTISVWQVAGQMLGDAGFRTHLVKTRRAYMFVCLVNK